MTEYRILKEADLPLEVVILLIAGMTMLLTGVLLFPVHSGALPYYENGLYGLLLVIFSLQIITLGKTPFGDAHRSKTLFAVGVVIAAVGIVICFIPVISTRIPRLLLVLCFGAGGALQFVQMFFDRDKYRAWKKYGGIFRQLIIGCSSVYGLSMLIALLILRQSLLSITLTAFALMVYGAAIIYLACILKNIYSMYPQAEKTRKGEVELSTDQTLLLLTAVFMLLLGTLLVPVNMGLLPFSGSAQLGLLMVIFAVQMLSAGNTPIGSFPRSWLMILFGLIFAALGIVSCMIPEVLVPLLTVFVGVLNILGGVIPLAKKNIFLPRESGDSSSDIPPVMRQLFATQLGLNLLGILFGTSMLVSNLIPGPVIGVILAANGCVLLYLLRILTVLDKMRCDAASAGPF